MKAYLTNEERGKIILQMTKEQKVALFRSLKLTHKSRMGNILAAYKGSREWEFYGYIDHGKVRKSIRCECGQPLRYQFILKNRVTGEKKSLGVIHLQDELKMSSKIANAVHKGIQKIDYDLDEILIRFKAGWKIPSYIERNLSELPLTKEMKLLLDHGLPLLERQVDYLAEKGVLINRKNGTGYQGSTESRFSHFPNYVQYFVLQYLYGFDYEVSENCIIATKEDYLILDRYTITKEEEKEGYKVIHHTIDRRDPLSASESEEIFIIKSKAK